MPQTAGVRTTFVASKRPPKPTSKITTSTFCSKNMCKPADQHLQLMCLAFQHFGETFQRLLRLPSRVMTCPVGTL